MNDGIAEKPQPNPSDIAAGYWQAAREGRFVLQTCTDCRLPRHYPRPVCARCHSLKFDWVEASGRGSVYSWTVAHHAYHPGFKGEIPYVLLTVELDEGVRALGRLKGERPERLKIGLAVNLTLTPTENGYSLPLFELVGET